MGRVTGRSDDMLIIRGVNVFPSQVEEALLRVEAAAPHYMIEVERPGALDEVTVHVELRPELFSDSMAALNAIHDRIVSNIREVTGLHMRVLLVQPNTLPRFEGKSKRVNDRRQLQQG
jgi:phenylacetate-CoA ligase